MLLRELVRNRWDRISSLGAAKARLARFVAQDVASCGFLSTRRSRVVSHFALFSPALSLETTLVSDSLSADPFLHHGT